MRPKADLMFSSSDDRHRSSREPALAADTIGTIPDGHQTFDKKASYSKKWRQFESGWPLARLPVILILKWGGVIDK
jgi:hypothetical protein